MGGKGLFTVVSRMRWGYSLIVLTGRSGVIEKSNHELEVAVMAVSMMKFHPVVQMFENWIFHWRSNCKGLAPWHVIMVSTSAVTIYFPALVT